MPRQTTFLRKETRNLACKLTDPELRIKGDELATTVQEIATEAGNQKGIKDSLKMRMSELVSRQGRLAYVVSRREEYRDVEVSVDMDDLTGQVTEVRMDSGELIQTRPPRESERQPGLGLYDSNEQSP